MHWQWEDLSVVLNFICEPRECLRSQPPKRFVHSQSSTRRVPWPHSFNKGAPYPHQRNTLVYTAAAKKKYRVRGKNWVQPVSQLYYMCIGTTISIDFLLINSVNHFKFQSKLCRARVELLDRFAINCTLSSLVPQFHGHSWAAFRSRLLYVRRTRISRTNDSVRGQASPFFCFLEIIMSGI